MKRTDWLGAVFFLGGILLYGFTIMGAMAFIPQMDAWNNPPGKYWSAVQQGGAIFPLIFSWVLLVVGALLLLWKEMIALYKKWDH